MKGFSYCEAWSQELKEAMRTWERWCYLQSSLEAKLNRVEPESEEYWETLRRLYSARENIRVSGRKATALRVQFEQERNYGFPRK